MDLWHSLNGVVELEIISADPAHMLSDLYEQGIPLSNIRHVDELTVRLQVKRQYVKKVIAHAEKRGEISKILSQKGLFWHFCRLSKRPALAIGFAFYLLLTVFLPTRIYFFRVEGNQNVPENLILELASQCGLSFGSERRQVRSEQVKNALLGAVPELEWVGINTAGCVATISVRERQAGGEVRQPLGVSSIIASCDGVIKEMTVTGGSALCTPGQSVRAGDVLISGYTDCGLTIRAERAKGEVYAATNRELTFVMPEKSYARGARTRIEKNYGIIIGKNRINFSQDSGILDINCVKMYEENYLTLPGGFVLPIAIVTETCIYTAESTPTAGEDECSDLLSNLAQSYLREQMVAGMIMETREEFAQQEGALWLTGKYECHEMIGRERIEEIIEP
jgi:sporulation protein YqfD